VQKTGSELLLFFVIAILGMVLVFIPVLAMLIRDRRAREKLERERENRYIEREKQLMNVLTQNTEAITALKTVFQLTNDNARSALERVHKRIDDHGTALDYITRSVDEIKRTMQKSSE